MPTAQEKVIAYHIARLNDKNADVRLKSIEELAHYDDPSILEALRRLYENDDDHRVRKAAQETGRALFLRLRGQGLT